MWRIENPHEKCEGAETPAEDNLALRLRRLRGCELSFGLRDEACARAVPPVARRRLCLPLWPLRPEMFRCMPPDSKPTHCECFARSFHPLAEATLVSPWLRA